jgi:carbonic anhydrase
MQRWLPGELRTWSLPSEAVEQIAANGSSVAGLLITCNSECLCPSVVEQHLDLRRWLIHRTPGALVPPYGTGHEVEEALVEHAVNVLGVREVVVCGHVPCSVTEHLLPGKPGPRDVILRHWLGHAEAARAILAALPAADERAASERCVLTQAQNLLTHPVISAGMAMGRLSLWTWLLDEPCQVLLHAAPDATHFTRLVALNPDQNSGLRPGVGLQSKGTGRPQTVDPRWLERA